MIRPLNIDELDEKIYKYSLDIELIDKQHILRKLNEFLYFLESQPISKRIIERIEEDFEKIEINIPKESVLNFGKQKREFIESIKTPDENGALGYFLIKQTYKSEELYEDSYINLALEWYNCHGDDNQMQKDFNTLIFNPFVELLRWYISESQSHNEKDYFSKKEVDEFSDKLDKLRDEIRLGQEVNYEEIQELKELLKNLKKKNWGELLKGKLYDMVLSNVISFDIFSSIIKFITGEDLKFLE